MSSFFGTVNDKFIINVDVSNGSGEFTVPGFENNRSCGIHVKQVNFEDYTDNRIDDIGTLKTLIFEEDRTNLLDNSKQRDFYDQFLSKWNLLIGRYIIVSSFSTFYNNTLHLMDVIFISDYNFNGVMNDKIIRESRKFFDKHNIAIDLGEVNFLQFSTYPKTEIFDSYKLNFCFSIFKPLSFDLNDEGILNVTFGPTFNGPSEIDFYKNEIYEWTSNNDEILISYLDSGVPRFFQNSVVSRIVKEQVVKITEFDEEYFSVVFGFMTNIFQDSLKTLLSFIQSNNFDLFITVRCGKLDNLCVGSKDIIQAVFLEIEPDLDYCSVISYTNKYFPSDETFGLSDLLLITSENLYNSTIASKNSYEYLGVLYLGPSHFFNWITESDRDYVLVKPDSLNPFTVEVRKFVTGITGPTGNTVPVTGKLTMEIRFVNIVNPLIYNNFQATWR